jgi:hypothetical protein
MDTKDAKSRLVNAFGSLLEEGLDPADILDALKSAIEQRKAMAHGISSPRQREQSLLFYNDVLTIIKDTSRRFAVARRSARMIAG